MDDLIIEPKRGIGTINLRMSKSEVERCINDYAEKYEKHSYNRDGFKHCFQVEYDADERAIFIQLVYSLKDYFNCVFKDINIFTTKATELVSILEQISPYDRDHWELGCTYYFPEIGLSLWRSSKFIEEDIEKEWFKELSLEQQEEELRMLYFQTVSVETESYRS